MKPLPHPYLAALFLSITAKAAMAERLVDPTRPPDASTLPASQPTGTLRLEAILRAGDRNLAIVNGKVVRAGERVGDARIDEIFADGVRYTRDGRSYTAKLADKAMKVRRNVAGGEKT
jgi:MSHA biogenesis protein MshK